MDSRSSEPGGRHRDEDQGCEVCVGGGGGGERVWRKCVDACTDMDIDCCGVTYCINSGLQYLDTSKTALA